MENNLRVERWEFSISNESWPAVREHFEEGETTEWRGLSPMVEALVCEINRLRYELREKKCSK